MSICFHCGGNHKTSACYIQAQNQTTKTIEKIGYQQLSTMDNLALAYRDSVNEMSSNFDRMSDRVSQSLGEVVGAIQELTDIFEFNHAEMMWQMERQLEVLTGIHDMVKNPRATESDEILKMGMASLERGMVTESLSLLQEAVKLNPLDYRIYITMGYTYLRMDDLKNARDRFEYALKNARTNYYKSFSLLLISRVYYCLEDIKKALDSAKLAMDLSPDYPEARYQYAAYLSKNRIK
ncbi:MAG: hypothetical protein U9R02_06675 [Thermodesulfobacteriota bacterium]|nr:hypothetical protein [Thermodesulfobacteriota bacterium]